MDRQSLSRQELAKEISEAEPTLAKLMRPLVDLYPITKEATIRRLKVASVRITTGRTGQYPEGLVSRCRAFLDNNGYPSTATSVDIQQEVKSIRFDYLLTQGDYELLLEAAGGQEKVAEYIRRTSVEAATRDIASR